MQKMQQKLMQEPFLLSVIYDSNWKWKTKKLFGVNFDFFYFSNSISETVNRLVSASLKRFLTCNLLHCYQTNRETQI